MVSRKKILLIGSDGQLAFDLNIALASSYEVVKLNHHELNIVDFSACKKVFAKFKPNIVINTAAYHKTSDCELHPDKSFTVNAIGAFNCSKAAREIGASIIFISSDYVFDGSKKSFKEDDLPNPLNIYGASKLAGEALTKIGNPKHYIIRTSWLYGKKESGKGHNFVYLILNKVKKGEKIKVVNDQFGCPTYTLDLANKIVEVLIKDIPAGIYNIVNSGSCSWYDFAQKILEIKSLKAKLIPVKTSYFYDGILRPKHSILNCGKLKRYGIQPMQKWDKALKSFIEELA